MSFLNFAMLAGLVAVAIPPIIHLLNRRRYEVVDWGAMQFLQISEVTRRRILIEEILLMGLRMGLIAILVLALAQPFTDRNVMTAGGRPSRDVVLVFDGSASLSFKQGDQSTFEKGQEWATNFVDGLKPGDGVAVIVARKQPVLAMPKLTADRVRVRDAIHKLPPPGGGADLARAVSAAYAILDTSQKTERDVIVIGDGQKHGWADVRSMRGWEDLKSKRDSATEFKPNLWCVNLDPARTKDVANWSLAPLTTGRAVVAVGQRLRFRSAIVLTGSARYTQPHAFRAEIDGQGIELEDEKGNPYKLPDSSILNDEKKDVGGQVVLDFFIRAPAKPGSHLLSVILEPDPPRSRQQAGYVIKDHLPLDNRRDFALEVVSALPVLIVDGDDKLDAKNRGSDFLRDALAPARDTNPVVKARVVPVQDFNPNQLRNPDPNQKDSDEKPRVLILCNVAKLNQSQQQGIETYLKEGGGVLVALGDRADVDVYNRQFHREGQGWLPARLGKVLGEENQLTKAARPLTESFYHPALELFRKDKDGGLSTAYFSRWWRLTPPDSEERGTVIAKLDKNETPFLIEGRRGEGRILVCAVPLDTSWRTNLVDLLGFVPLAHEVVYYLADSRAAEHNVEPGQPLRYRVPPEGSSAGLTLRSPTDAEPKPLVIDGEDSENTYTARLASSGQGPLVIKEGLFETGVWRLTTNDGDTVHYVVQPDPSEANLAPLDDEDRKKVSEFAAFRYENESDALLLNLSLENRRTEFWWWFLLGVVLMLCGEVWLTRRIVKNRM